MLCISHFGYLSNLRLKYFANKHKKPIKNYDVNRAPRALSKWRRIRWFIPMHILNIFGYGTYDLVIQTIRLHSYTLV